MVKIPEGYGRTTSGKLVKVKKIAKTSPGTNDRYWNKAKKGFGVREKSADELQKGFEAERAAMSAKPKVINKSTSSAAVRSSKGRLSKTVKSTSQKIHNSLRSTLRSAGIKKFPKAKPLAATKNISAKAIVKGKYLGQKAAVAAISKGKRVLRNPGGKVLSKLPGRVALGTAAVAGAAALSTKKGRSAAKSAVKKGISAVKKTVDRVKTARRKR